METPNIDRIARDGVRYTQWHTTALCSPTRSCLLTGRNHTRNSMARLTEAAMGFPNASGTTPPESGMLPEILGELGWNTYMVSRHRGSRSSAQSRGPPGQLRRVDARRISSVGHRYVDLERAAAAMIARE